MSAHALVLTVIAGSVFAAGWTARSVGQEPDAPLAAEPALERLKALAGDWTLPDEDGDGAPDGTVRYATTAGGSVVVETLFPGEEYEMISMYHRDGERLVMTHYCMAGNQPRMRQVSADAPEQVKFEFMDGTNMKSRNEMHMDSLTITFIDADHVRSVWTSYADGKTLGTKEFNLTRVKR